MEERRGTTVVEARHRQGTAQEGWARVWRALLICHTEGCPLFHMPQTSLPNLSQIVCGYSETVEILPEERASNHRHHVFLSCSTTVRSSISIRRATQDGRCHPYGWMAWSFRSGSRSRLTSSKSTHGHHWTVVQYLLRLIVLNIVILVILRFSEDAEILTDLA